MATQLSVVNDCLAVMGEAPLNTLLEDHEYKAAALNRLTSENSRIQGRKGVGWWFNQEAATLSTNSDGRIYLPGDALSITIRDPRMRPQVAQRGRVLYNLADGTDRFVIGTQYPVTLVRLVPFEAIPESVASYIAASVVLWFQNQYDGDQTKTRNLAQHLQEREADAMAENTRNRNVNLLDNNVALAHIRNIVRQGRRY